MAGDYRPDVIVYQKFVTPTPAVGTTPLYLLIAGVNRQLEWEKGGQQYQGGQANDPFNFPDLVAGAEVETDTADDTLLRPHVFLQNKYGKAEVTPTYNWAVDPPTFTLSPTLDATFVISTGTTGEYSSTTGKFIDANADFIEDEVAAGDVIKVDGVPSFDVVGLVNDDELDVTRIDKAPGTWTGNITTLDANDDRTFTDDSTTVDFVADGYKVGDILTVQGWDIISQAGGIDYAAEVTGIRLITGSTYDFAGAGVAVPSVTVPPYTVDIIWIKDLEGDWVPAFQVSANVATTTLDAVNLITSTRWPASSDFRTNKVFEIYHYAQIALKAGPAVYTDSTGNYTDTGGVPGGNRTFTISPTAGIDFTTLGLGASHSVVVRGISDAGTGFLTSRPIFKVISVDSATQLTVQNWDPDRPQDSTTGTNVTWEIWNDGGAAILSFLGSSITAENPGDQKRTLTSAYSLFITGPTPVTVGDTVYSDAGVPLFLVTDIDLDTQLRCVNIVPGTPASTWSDSSFGFYISAQTQAQLRITRVVDSHTLIVRELIAGSPTDDVFPGLLYTVTVPNDMEDLNYTIEKTLSGSLLSGEVLVTYAARRNDRTDAPFQVTAETFEEELGPAVPANPLGFGALLAFKNMTIPLYCYQIEDDTVAAWENALTKIKIEDNYIVCPLTENETVLGLYREFIDQESDPLEKREKILFQSHRFLRTETRTESAVGDVAAYTKTVTTTTITVNRDLEASGVVVGDVFEGTDPLFSARIITIVSGTTTTLTVVNDNGLPTGTGVAINDWYVRSKDLTDLEFANKVGAYPGTLANRRYRNVYPDRCEIVFTDTTDPNELSGFYGGGDVTLALEGYYLAALEGSKRAQNKPAQSLTKMGGTGIHKLLNPFGTSVELNDIVLDGGNYLLYQLTTDGDVAAVRAVTTDMTEIYKLEDSVTVQIDSFAKKIRVQLRPYLGPYNIDEGPYFDLVSAAVNAVIEDVVKNKDMRRISFISIKESETSPDTLELVFEVVPFVAAAKIIVTIYV